MADKFTRTAVAEGDVLYATTSSSSKSIESLEDNIDNKLMTYVGSDTTGGTISNSLTETKIAEVIIPANTVRNEIFIMVTGEVSSAGESTNNGTFKVYLGTNAAFASNTVKLTRSMSSTSHSNTSTTVGGGPVFISFNLRNTDQTWTSQIYVQVTGTNSTTTGTTSAYCKVYDVYILGI